MNNRILLQILLFSLFISSSLMSMLHSPRSKKDKQAFKRTIEDKINSYYYNDYDEGDIYFSESPSCESPRNEGKSREFDEEGEAEHITRSKNKRRKRRRKRKKKADAFKLASLYFSERIN